MKDYFEVKSANQLKLTDIPVRVKPKYRSEQEYRNQLEHNREHLECFQTLLYANRSRSMLIVFQGMDTAGKDGAIKHVMSGINPQGCSVVSFKAPNLNELEHDFLWRVTRELPARGKIGIFNRSYYEEALITRVHPELLELERLPPEKEYGGRFWDFRYHDIVSYEKYLHRQGWEIVKIFIHISKDEQRLRLLNRFEDPKKQWKISEGDVRERSYWKEYQAAYETCIDRTASKSCPWYIVPGDDKESARLAISKILVSRFKKMKLKYPKLSRDEEKKLKNLKSQLKKE